MLEKDSVDHRESKSLFEDTGVEVEVEEVSEIERIGRLDHLCPKETMELLLEFWVRGKKTESVPFCGVRGHHTDSSGA
jgi:hypothetical protein